MRKRTSRRRWKARALRGRLVPLTAIVEHRLDAWRKFEPTSAHSDMYFLPDVLSRASLGWALEKIRKGDVGKIILRPRLMFIATGSADFLTADVGDRRWMPL